MIVGTCVDPEKPPVLMTASTRLLTIVKTTIQDDVRLRHSRRATVTKEERERAAGVSRRRTGIGHTNRTYTQPQPLHHQPTNHNATHTQHLRTRQRAYSTYICNKRISEIRPGATSPCSYVVSPRLGGHTTRPLAAASIPIWPPDVGRRRSRLIVAREELLHRDV